MVLSWRLNYVDGRHALIRSTESCTRIISIRIRKEHQKPYILEILPLLFVAVVHDLSADPWELTKHCTEDQRRLGPRIVIGANRAILIVQIVDDVLDKLLWEDVEHTGRILLLERAIDNHRRITKRKSRIHEENKHTDAFNFGRLAWIAFLFAFLGGTRRSPEPPPFSFIFAAARSGLVGGSASIGTWSSFLWGYNAATESDWEFLWDEHRMEWDLQDKADDKR